MGKIKILLVDDEREEREGISWLIEKYEYPLEIMQASNGKEALQWIEKTKIDILFTDVKMPIMNGLELAKKVHDTRPEIKIIIFSAYGEFSYAKQALEANAVSYLLKPIEIEEFQKIMVSVIESVQRENEEGERLQTAEIQNRRNLLYSIIKAIYDKVPKIEFEEALSLAEALFRAKSLKNMMEVYQNAVDKMLSFLEGEEQDESRMIQKIKNLIEKEYARDISLNYVAENVNLTPAYVSYIFKKETGQTLVKYVTDIKMMKAKKMLEEGTMKIVQVAKTCGYENQSYFNRLFKNYYGVTPKQLREKL